MSIDQHDFNLLFGDVAEFWTVLVAQPGTIFPNASTTKQTNLSAIERDYFIVERASAAKVLS